VAGEIDECLAEITRLLRLIADEKARAATAGPTVADRLDTTLKLLTKAGLAALLAVAAFVLIGMSIDAKLSQSVVVEEFTVPKSLLDHGLTGRAAAAAMLDALERTERETRLAGGKRRIAEAWDEPIKLEIPETGLSVGDLANFLHDELSADIHVRGELEQLPDGTIALDIRGDGIPAKRFVGKEAEFTDNAEIAAEYVYGSAEPVSFATYLVQKTRVRDGLDFAARVFPSTPRKLRPALATLWGTLKAYSGDFAGGVELTTWAKKLDPYYWPAWAELAQDERLLDGPEAELKAFRAMEAAGQNAPYGHKPQPIDFRLEYNLLHDPLAEIRALQQDRRQVASGTQGTAAWSGLAAAELGRHGVAAAKHCLDEADPNDPLLDNHMQEIRAAIHQAESKALANDRNPDDLQKVVREQEEVFRRNRKNVAITNMIPDGPCMLAIAYAQVGGRDKDARDILALVEKRNPKVGCGGNAGIILDLLGDTQGATKAFADVIKAEPSLPEPYEQRGEFRAGHNDFAGAADDFAAAHKNAPNWADPLKLWGDALVHLGKPAEALQKYDAALSLAPEWKELIDARAKLGAPPFAPPPESDSCGADLATQSF
jgi:tetratricopeptide (TPR) repeat protein